MSLNYAHIVSVSCATMTIVPYRLLPKCIAIDGCAFCDMQQQQRQRKKTSPNSLIHTEITPNSIAQYYIGCARRDTHTFFAEISFYYILFSLYFLKVIPLANTIFHSFIKSVNEMKTFVDNEMLGTKRSALSWKIHAHTHTHTFYAVK